jgi:hypothetical protein
MAPVVVPSFALLVVEGHGVAVRPWMVLTRIYVGRRSMPPRENASGNLQNSSRRRRQTDDGRTADGVDHSCRVARCRWWRDHHLGEFFRETKDECI